jgi:hypothetical protein
LASKTVKTQSLNGRKRTKDGKSLNGSAYKNTDAGKYTHGKKSEMTEEQRTERRKKAALATFAAAYESHHKKH